MTFRVSNAYFMTLFVNIVKWHIGNVFNTPSRQKKSHHGQSDNKYDVIFMGIEKAFRKAYPTKIPGMVHLIRTSKSMYSPSPNKVLFCLLICRFHLYYLFSKLFQVRCAILDKLSH